MRIRSVLAAFATIALFVPNAQALDIGSIEVLWLTDSVDGALIGNPYGMEVEVELIDNVNLGRIEVVPAAGGIGSFDLSTPGGTWYEIPGSVTTQFSSSALLFSDFPGGDWTFNFRDGAEAIIDSFSITLSPVEVMDIIDITSPTHMSSFLIGGSVDWLDCSGCDGSQILGFAWDIAADTDRDEFSTTVLSTTTWSPTNLIPGNDTEFEIVLANLTHDMTAESTTGGDSFSFLAGYANLNLLEVAVVPEPGTGLLLALGLAGLAVHRRRRVL